MGRVPLVTAPALDAGRLLHRIFERHFNGETMEAASRDELKLYEKLIPSAHPAAQPSARKALQVMEDLREALPLWEDKFPVKRVLEIEKQSLWKDPVADIEWLLTPDRGIVSGQRIYHVQNRGLAASMNFGTYTRLALRHYHEHLYGEYFEDTYGTARLHYAGVIFNLVRKLKYRTNAGKSNETVKAAAEMFFQTTVSINLGGNHHKAVMKALRQHVSEMKRVHKLWDMKGIIPAPNERMNGGYSGSSEDLFFRVLIGEIKLSDDAWFKNREERYSFSGDE